MSSSQDAVTQRAALDRAGEGWRLLSDGDYEGAIAACTEAIELDFSSLGARRTRAEAYSRLGRVNEPGADLAYLGDGGKRGNEESSSDDGAFWPSFFVISCIGIVLAIMIVNPMPEWGRGGTVGFVLLGIGVNWILFKLFPGMFEKD